MVLMGALWLFFGATVALLAGVAFLAVLGFTYLAVCVGAELGKRGE